MSFFEEIPTSFVEPNDLQAGRPVIRSATRRGFLSDFIQLTSVERTVLDAELVGIDEAQKIGLETGSIRIIGTKT